MSKKIRLDQRVLQEKPEYSRQQIQSWIMQGKVLVDGKPITKAGTPVSCDVAIEVTAQSPRYVSRAGYKLEGALSSFNIDVTGLVALDAGLSTGGFTDCLLQAGAVHVYGIDVGYGQVHEKISSDPRVTVYERTNLRYVEQLPQLVDLVTLDVSFISVLKVINVVYKLAKPGAQLIVLIKPQFEARPDQVGKGGIIRSEDIRQETLKNVIAGISNSGFTLKGVIDSPLPGTDGNLEFLAYFTK